MFNTQQQQAFDAMRQALEKAEPMLCDYEHSVSGGDSEINVEPVILAVRDALTAAKEVTAQGVEPTVPDNMQEWKGMDGTIAWHLMERHADNWSDIGKMMGEWLAANQQPAPAQRLSDDEVFALWPKPFVDRTEAKTFKSAIETAFAEKNGITLEQKHD